MQLNAVVLHWPRDEDGSGYHRGHSSGQEGHAEAARLLRNLAVEVREAGLVCVEKIVAWALEVSGDASEPHPFLWNGTDYLVSPPPPPAPQPSFLAAFL